MNSVPTGATYHLSADRVAELHDAAISAHGGSPEVLREGCVEGSLGSAATAELYTRDDGHGGGRQGDGLRYAIYLFRYLALNHCYQDGNKRVAWLALVDVLAVFDLTINATPDEAADWVNYVITNSHDEAKIGEWLEPRLIERPPPAAKPASTASKSYRRLVDLD